ncbi:hypothetical protein [Rathayibacter sp. VKM Ac-2927]|uniref:hypothetical protein n=1 Tax=Rathayibacter sp. VKM Ac-2927 TaxID=2929478 RepID=UPI001FB1AD24|nr:hypothetical protein [Rathayibacter sp. VKM Ac-2927]MCJ1686200.1 hypothetical protein [Rathayibacter sp. VKM Ac-2927]
MSLVVDTSACVVDREGCTYGMTASGDVVLTGEIAGWIRLVAAWTEAGIDVDERARSLDPVRADQLRRVRSAMLSLGVLREAPVAGRVSFLGETALAERAVVLNGRALPESCLAVGPVAERWLIDEVRQHRERTFGAVLLHAGGALVVGPASGSDLLPVLVAVAERGVEAGRPVEGVVRQAVAQLARRVEAGRTDPWRARTVTAAGSVLTRISPHPWQAGQPEATGPFEERATTVVDPDFGVLRLIEEADLPQVPRHHSRVRVACDAVVARRDVEVVGEGADFAAARSDAVRRALAVRAESVLDPRRVLDGAGRAVAAPTASLEELREAVRRVVAAPTASTVPGRLLADGSTLRVPVSLAFRCSDAAPATGGLGVAETAEEALRLARETAPASDPRAVVVDLDHDPVVARLGLVVRKVVILP